MTQRKQPESYLWDMREAAKTIDEFMKGVKFHQFENNKMLTSAVERQLLIIGEAAVHIAPQYRKQHPEINWEVFIRFRNILAHEYGESLLNRIWLAANERVPELLTVIPKLLPDDNMDDKN
ncbi:MAG: DUF86 domain-containing protein [Anaerolineales bacterium]